MLLACTIEINRGRRRVVPRKSRKRLESEQTFCTRAFPAVASRSCSQQPAIFAPIFLRYAPSRRGKSQPICRDSSSAAIDESCATKISASSRTARLRVSFNSEENCYTRDYVSEARRFDALEKRKRGTTRWLLTIMEESGRGDGHLKGRRRYLIRWFLDPSLGWYLENGETTSRALEGCDVDGSVALTRKNLIWYDF